MLYPLLLKRIANRVKNVYEDFVINKESLRLYPEYSKWIDEYLSLSEVDVKNIITKFERSQTATIIYAMRMKDREIFINQLGMFYIKQTTIDYYKGIEDRIGDKVEGEYDLKEIKQSALEECRALYIKRANAKRDAKNPIDFCPKI